MNLENVKKKLKEIRMSVKLSDTNHPKIAIASLCDVLQTLIVEIENLKRPKITLTSPEQTVPINTMDNPHEPYKPIKIPRKEKFIPTKNPKSPYEPSRVPRKRFNAGDAK